MSLRRRFCSSVRPSLHRLLLTASLALAVAGCGDPGDEGPCTEAQGTLSGTIWYSAKDSGMVIPFGTVELALEPIDYPNSTLLSFKADLHGKFSVPLDPGTWEVSGYGSLEGVDCWVIHRGKVDLQACETEEIDVELDACQQ